MIRIFLRLAIWLSGVVLFRKYGPSPGSSRPDHGLHISRRKAGSSANDIARCWSCGSEEAGHVSSFSPRLRGAHPLSISDKLLDTYLPARPTSPKHDSAQFADPKAVDTSLEVIYEPRYTYALRAGVGQFRGNYVEPYIKQFNTMNPGYAARVVPYSNLAIVHDLVVNPIHSVISQPINCTTESCDSYLLPGGLALTTPWPPTNFSQQPVIAIHSTIGMQLDFQEGLLPGDTFNEEDCDVFGQANVLIGIRSCVGRSKVKTGALIAGS